MGKMSNGLVSIIVVTAGIKDYLKFLLDSISKQTNPVSETIIIDNSLSGGVKVSSIPNIPIMAVFLPQSKF
jgi:hypothetical protein